MPYITHERGKELADGQLPETPGELNFMFSIIAGLYLYKKGLSYQHVNDVLGALEGAKLELYRRVAAPYEDKKRAENGDVYPPDILT